MKIKIPIAPPRPTKPTKPWAPGYRSSAMPKSESLPVTTPMHNPAHPGEMIHDLCLNDCGAEAASARLGIAREVLEPVLAGEAPMTASLAIDLEEAGIGNAALWMRMQATYALAQERLRSARGS